MSLCPLSWGAPTSGWHIYPTRARLDRSRGDDFADPSLRMGSLARDGWRSASGGHSPFSPHGQHRHARYPRDGRRAGGNGTSCCVEGRAEVESRATAAAIALGLAGFARSHLALLLPLAAFFCWTASIPGRFWDRFAGNHGFGLRSLQVLHCCWQSLSLFASITWPSIPLQLLWGCVTYRPIFLHTWRISLFLCRWQPAR